MITMENKFSVSIFPETSEFGVYTNYTLRVRGIKPKEQVHLSIQLDGMNPLNLVKGERYTFQNAQVVPATDKAGKPILDKEGKPCFNVTAIDKVERIKAGWVMSQMGDPTIDLTTPEGRVDAKIAHRQALAAQTYGPVLSKDTTPEELAVIQ